MEQILNVVPPIRCGRFGTYSQPFDLANSECSPTGSIRWIARRAMITLPTTMVEAPPQIPIVRHGDPLLPLRFEMA